MNKFYTNVIQYGNKIFERGYKNGLRYQQTIKYKPTLFGHSALNGETKFQTIKGQPVVPIEFDSIYDAKNFIKQNEDVHNSQLHGQTNFVSAYIHSTWNDEVPFDLSKIRILYIDIETECESGFPDPELAGEVVNAISIVQGDRTYGLGLESVEVPDGVYYFDCENEDILLRRFLKLIEYLDPDIITGWNISQFDIPYLVNRIGKCLGSDDVKRLSPVGIVKGVTGAVFNVRECPYQIFGRAIIDYMDLFKKYGVLNQIESYALDFVAYYVLGEKKLDYSEYGSLHTLYKENYQKFIEYNIRDTQLVYRIEQERKLIEMIIVLAYIAKVNFTDTFKQTRMWDSIISDYLFQRNVVVPVKTFSEEKKDKYKGAYVKDPIVGMHQWVVSFDLNSLYPHLIMQYNIGPDTIVGERDPNVSVDNVLEGKYLNKEKKYSVAANGQMFRKDKQGFLAHLMEQLYVKRKEIQKTQKEAKQKFKDTNNEVYKREADKLYIIQYTYKVVLNSCYGALGNQFFRFYDTRQAEAITYSGQLSARWIEKKINLYLNKLLQTNGVDYIVASDTDSVYVKLDELVNVYCKDRPRDQIVNFLDRFCEKKLQPYIDKSYEELADIMGAYAQKMFMSREVITEKAIWTAKKKYVMTVLDDEGLRLSYPKLKIMGIEAVRSSTPEVCRKRLRNALRIMLTKDEAAVQKYIKLFQERFNTFSFHDIAFPRTVNNLTKYQDKDKSIPIHVRGALVYNRLLEHHGLENKYERIKDSDKIKFAYLQMPNPINENIIAVKNVLPVEFGLDEYIDYDLQFEKAFISPINYIMEPIGWSPKKIMTLEELF